jgi:hypothetical protein
MFFPINKVDDGWRGLHEARFSQSRRKLRVRV